ncbi:Dual specificity testis-specific protein kinase 2 [Portunus trituberculatus]|uniref:Dual specificity testis-specific protein kinase 2 n=1 Tax=Portunus trituberculatus TaxID=210409 RepID=A0A5B7DAW0_PORTR|nr:Dual specificity testis-specific protein kinase 2 [Portunus trituberculatus]
MTKSDFKNQRSEEESCSRHAKGHSLSPTRNEQLFRITKRRKHGSDRTGKPTNMTTLDCKGKRLVTARVVTKSSLSSTKRQSGVVTSASQVKIPATEHTDRSETVSSSLSFETAATRVETSSSKANQEKQEISKRHQINQRKLSKKENAAMQILQAQGVPLLTTGDVADIVSMGTQKLGEGSYGSCDKTVDPKTRQPLVIKTFSPFKFEAFFLEAVNLNIMRLPGVQRLVGVCVHTRQIITDFAGITSSHYFKRSGPSFVDIISVFWQISRTLEQVLDKGFAHNDLKEDNVCVKMDNDVPTATIIDFGLARRVGSSKIYRKTSCTYKFPWLAPELLQHTHPCSEASDVYSLAQLLQGLLRSRRTRSPYLDAFQDWVSRGQRDNPGERPRLSALTHLLQLMHEHATKDAKE